jgi:hypothetical protein
MAMIAPNHGLTGKQLAALNLLAACPDGCTEAAMKANGFGIGLLATLVRAGLAVATPGVVQAGAYILVMWVPLMVAAHQRAAPPQPRGGRSALAGERT